MHCDAPPQLYHAGSEDQALFREHAPDLIRLRGAFVDQAFAHSMQRLERLLFCRLDRNKSQIGTPDRRTNGRCIIGVILATNQEGLHILRRNQPHVVTDSQQFTAPEVRAVTSLYPDETWRKLREESQ